MPVLISEDKVRASRPARPWNWSGENLPGSTALFSLSFLICFGIFYGALGSYFGSELGIRDPAGIHVSAQVTTLLQSPQPKLNLLSAADPPLPVILSTLIAVFFKTSNPAFLLSVLTGAIFSTWLLIQLRGHVARLPIMSIPLIFGIVHPVLLADFISGSPDALFYALFVPALYFLSRFILEHSAYTRRRKDSKLPADAEEHLFINERIKFLWAFAFCFAAASLVRPALFLTSPMILFVSAYALGGQPWKNINRSISLAIVLLLPSVVVQIAWNYSAWIYSPATGKTIQAFPDVFSLTLSLAGIKETFETNTALTCFVSILIFAPIIWILFRLRNIALAILFLCAPLACLFSMASGATATSVLLDLTIIAYFSALIILFLASDLHILPKVESTQLAAILPSACILLGILVLISKTSH